MNRNPRPARLLACDEFGSPVLLVTALGGIATDRTLLSETDRIDSGFTDPLFNQVLLYRVCPPVTQTDVVFLTTTLVGMARDGEADARILPEEPCIVL